MKKHPYYTSVIGIILFYSLSGFFLAPYLLQKNVTEIMQKEFDARLSVEKIEVNPFALSLRINGLELDNPADAPTIRIREIFTNFQLSSIFRLAFTFDEIRFTQPELFVSRNNAGDMDFSYLLKPGDSEPAPGDNTEKEQDSSPLPILVYNFTIEDFIVNWSDQVPAQAVKTQFGPINIDVKDLNTLRNRTGQQAVEIATEEIGTLSWQGELQLNPLRSTAQASLRNSQFSLVSAYTRYQSGLDIVDGSADLDLNYEVFETQNGDIEANASDINLTIVDLVIDSFADGTGFDFAGSDQQILKLAKIQIADGKLQWPDQSVVIGSISVEDPKISASRDANGIFNLQPRELSTDTAEPASDEDDSEIKWQISVAEFAVKRLSLDLIDQSVSPGANLGITDFSLAINDISNLPGKSFPTTLDLQAKSGGKLSLKGNFSALPEPEFDFDVVLDAIQLKAGQPYLSQQANLKLDSGSVNLDGRIKGSSAEPFAFAGNLEIADLSLAESINDERLASWQSFRADKIALSLANQRLDISRLYFDQLYGDILINRDGTVNVGQIGKSTSEAAVQTDDMSAQKTDAVTADDGKESEFAIQIGGIDIAQASADFADLSLPLPFAVKINSLNGKMTTISNRSSEPSEVSLEGRVDEYGFARINGIVTPLEPTKNTDLLVSFENIDVPKFTPYTIPFAGRKIASGTLDLKLGYVVKDSELVGENSIILRDFELGDKVPHPDALDIPLGLAVALLTDSSGKIDIDLPVRGNFDNPEFSYGGAVWSALGNLLVKIVLSPFNLLGNLLGIEPSELESIRFIEGRSDLTPPEMQTAGKLAEALALRPELQLVINGVYDPVADDLALRTAQFKQQLETLIAEITAVSDPSLQFAVLRRMALEQMFSEQLTTGDAAQQLAEMQKSFTSLVEGEGQSEPVEKFDSLAYTGELRRQLIDSQTLENNALENLASARANALKTALVTIDESLKARVIVRENTTVSKEDGEPIEMKVTLGSKQG